MMADASVASRPGDADPLLPTAAYDGRIDADAGSPLYDMPKRMQNVTVNVH